MCTETLFRLNCAVRNGQERIRRPQGLSSQPSSLFEPQPHGPSSRSLTARSALRASGSRRPPSTSGPRCPRAAPSCRVLCEPPLADERALELSKRSQILRRNRTARLGRTRNGRRRCAPSEIRRHLQASSGRYRERRDVPDLDRRKRVRYKCARHVRRRAAAAAFERARRKKTALRAARRFGKGAKNGQNKR